MLLRRNAYSNETGSVYGGGNIGYHPIFYWFLALSLLMALALGADYHNSAVSFDNFALIAHFLY